MNIRVFCEYMQNPVGIDMEHPRFSWLAEGGKPVGGQRSYRILVAKSEGDLKDKTSLVWDSGEQISGDRLNIPYAGEKLETAETYYFQVLLTDLEGETFASETGTFVMGILDADPWKADWLGGPWMEEWAFWFRSAISIEKKVKNAFVYVVSPNYYVLTVNGKRCTDAVLQNANTDSRKTVLYATYPVKDFLQQGENVLGVELGNGWKALQMSRDEAGLGEHSFSLQMLLNYEDGTSRWIYSKSEDWYYTNRGPLLENSIYHGETYDARLELTGWDRPGYRMEESEAPWYQAVEFEPEEGTIRAQILEPIKVVAERKPEKIYKIGDGSYTFDMGQNYAGWSRLKVRGERGTKIRMVHSELIHDDHTVNQISLRGMRATDTYILKGEGEEIYEPDFTYHGYRYVQVFGLPLEPGEDTITGCVVRSAVEPIGEFCCDNALLNQLQKNINWTEESNLHSIPTDCPQRDERLGWINDMTVRNEGALYNFRLAQLYTKWLQDVRDTQGKKTGAITDTAPFRVFGCRPADPVGAITFLLPWNLYLHYKDTNVMEACYETNRKLAAYLKRNSTDYVMRWATMGDWASPVKDTDMSSIGGGAVSMVTPPRMMATAYFYYDCCLMARMAGVLGKKEDEAFYKEEAGRIKEAFLRTYYDKEKKYFCTNSQGSNTIALYMGLAPEEDREEILRNLVTDIVETNDTHLTTGNLCSRYIVEVLLENGYRDVAYDLLTQTTYPSWGYMIENGATTIWERWEKITDECVMSRMASYNHPMYGAVGVCFYKHFAGIRPDETDPGFKKVLIHPIIPTKLKHVQAKVDTMAGRIVSEWKKEEDGSFVMKVEIPFGSTGEVRVPLEELGLTLSEVLVNGKELSLHKESVDGEGCRLTTADNTQALFDLSSGSYEIVCR
ncbi:MAG: family 78 glycoside hydrolase catalytic domain [Lachnospiraceae bacterium]|nr:family 78 glycoside hydrolase catalytic domain [Lachnospiraceae bacterium]